MSNLIPNGWEIKSIDEVATVFAGGTPSRSKPEYYVGNIPWVKSGEVNARLIYRTEETISEIAVKESSAKWAKSGSVLVAMYGATAGKVAKLMIDATLNQAVSAINGKHGATDNDFLLYAIESNSRELLNTVQGSGQPNLSGQLIKSLSFPVPPLPEQQKIATILSSVDDVIEKTRAQIDKLKDLKTGMMQELLTKGIGHTEFKDSDVGRIPINWEPLTVRDLVKLSGGSQPPRDTFVFSPRKGYVRMLQIRDYKSDRFATYIPKDLSKRWCNKDDIMIGRYGPPIFQIMRGKEGSYNVALIKAEPKTAVLLKSYLYHFLCRKDLFQLIDSYSQRTSGQTGIDMDALNDFGFPCPPLDEQLRIADCLDEMDGRIKLGQRKLQGLESCKKALMQDLLTGKVRVKITDKESAVV